MALRTASTKVCSSSSGGGTRCQATVKRDDDAKPSVGDPIPTSQPARPSARHALSAPRWNPSSTISARNELMAGLRARVGERLAGDRKELPGVAAVPKNQPQDAVGVLVERFHVRDRRPGLVPAPSGPDHELPEPTGGVGHALRGLRSKALVVMRMPGEDEIGIAVVQVLPELEHVGLGCAAGAA